MLPGSDVNPAGQSVQIEDPSVEYFPAGQVPEQDAVCNPLVAPHVPAGQSVQEDAPAREYFPRPQVPVQDALVKPVVASEENANTNTAKCTLNIQYCGACGYEQYYESLCEVLETS